MISTAALRNLRRTCSTAGILAAISITYFIWEYRNLRDQFWIVSKSLQNCIAISGFHSMEFTGDLTPAQLDADQRTRDEIATLRAEQSRC